MAKCLDCGNTEKFRIATINWDLVYYNKSGDVYDAKGLDVIPSDIPHECHICNSTNVEGL